MKEEGRDEGLVVWLAKGKKTQLMLGVLRATSGGSADERFSGPPSPPVQARKNRLYCDGNPETKPPGPPTVSRSGRAGGCGGRVGERERCGRTGNVVEMSGWLVCGFCS